MSKRIGLAIAGIAVVAVIGGGTAFAATSSSPTTGSANTIYGCYDSGRNLKVDLPLGTTTCPKGYSALDWNLAGPQGPAGTPGTDGTDGTNGTNGTNGTSLVTSSGPPAGACNLGDTDIDLLAGEVYTCESLPGWDINKNSTGGTGSGVPVIGWADTGHSIIGPQGPVGQAGNTVLSGSGAPDSSVGNPGDFYLDTDADVLYGPMTASGWPATGTSLIGPQGPSGPTSLDSMIGSPCDAGTSLSGTLQLKYTQQGDGTSVATVVCAETNPAYSLTLTVGAGGGAGLGLDVCVTPSSVAPGSGWATVAVPGMPCTGGENCAAFSVSNKATCTAYFQAATPVVLQVNIPAPSADNWTGCDTVSSDYRTCYVNMAGITSVTYS